MLITQLYISNIGGIISMATILSVVCVFLYVWGYRKQLDMIVFSSCLAMFITYSIKYMLDVPRPLSALVLETDGRFPSGHATMAAVVMGLGIYFGGQIKHRSTRNAVYVVSVLWFCAVAYSRLYLGVHVPIDVLAGGLIGLGSVLVVGKMFRHLRYYR
jgi:membrane-associated phospholipid phosphatase